MYTHMFRIANNETVFGKRTCPTVSLIIVCVFVKPVEVISDSIASRRIECLQGAEWNATVRIVVPRLEAEGTIPVVDQDYVQ